MGPDLADVVAAFVPADSEEEGPLCFADKHLYCMMADCVGAAAVARSYLDYDCCSYDW